MQDIVSFKFNPRQMRLKKFIDFYGFCSQWNQNIYVCGKNEAQKVDRLSELLSFILFSHDDECLIVIEGHGANEIKAYISQHMNGVLTS